MLLRCASSLILLGFLACCGAEGATLFDYGSPWRYLLGLGEASSPDPAAWRARTFDDSAWAAGPTPIGYANPPNSAPEFNIATAIPTTQEAGYVSVFFRRPFVVQQPAGVTQLTLNLNVDDGFIAWINGQEVGRYNVPDGVVPYNGTAVAAIEETITPLVLNNNPAALLVPGTNILAVQVFNANTSSSDLFMDASLSSDYDEIPPVLVGQTPPPDSLTASARTIEVVFSEGVAGVDVSDLRLNGVAATALQQISPADYVFTFPQPPDGLVHATWKASHGITDLSPAANPFTSVDWSFTVNSHLPSAPVVISEFLAENQTGIRDDDGSRADWIELYNSGSEPASLDGWFLTDAEDKPTKWRIPAVSIGAKGYLLIWASGQNRTNVSAPLHTNFKLARSGGYLALLDATTNLASAFLPKYPAQLPDVSYGRDRADASITGFFSVPTPGAANSTRGSGFAGVPAFSIAGGVYTNDTIVVRLTAPAGQIRYTLDGSLPTATSPLYSAGSPITLTTSTTVKARVFQAGLLPGDIVAEAYMILDRSVANFSSNLPLMIFSTTGVPVANHVPAGQPRTFASVVAVDVNQGRSSPFGPADFFGQCELGIRGQTSSGFPKLPYRLEFQDAYRVDTDASLFGLPADSDWILNNPYTDKPFIQNFLAQELFEKMGHYAVRRRFVEVFINTGGGKIQYPQDYAGIYILLEKIKVSGHRVDIAKLTPYDTSEPDISGGYMFKKDKDSAGDLNFSTPGGSGFSGQVLKVHEPQPSEITPAQLTWLNNYINRFEASLYAPGWKTATGTNHYSAFIDPDSFVDYHWIVEFSKQIDGYRLSNYLQKDRGGRIRMEPIWDWNLSFGNADYLDGALTNGWYYQLLGDADHIWLRRLIAGTPTATDTQGDPDFNQRIADRWSVLRTNVLAASNVLARVDQLATQLSEAADRDFQKYPRLGSYVWPNPPIYSTPTTYAGIISAMKTWISGRYGWIDSQFLKPPVPSSPGGRVPSGYKLTFSGISGTVYYTLDGSDPRQPGGLVSSAAAAYSTAGIVLSSNVQVTARSRSGARWSGPVKATFIVSPASLLLTEIMYHPTPPPAPSLYDASDFEFLEFRNAGATPLPLKGVTVEGGIRFAFTNASSLAPGARLLLVHTRAAFESRYGTALPVAGEFSGSLSDSGDRILVKGPLGEILVDVSYRDGWQPATDGSGFSLVLAREDTAPGLLDDESRWRPSHSEGGSPGAGDAGAPAVPPVVVSEVLNHSGLTGTDRIELQNIADIPVDVGGWYLSDDPEIPRKYRIPAGAGAVLPPGGFIVFEEAEFSGQALIPFGLSAQGDRVFLFSADVDGHLTGYRHGVAFGAQTEGASFGRYIDSLGGEHFVAMPSNSFGATNPSPWVPPLVISEIMYHPAAVAGLPAIDYAASGEYVEILNRGATPLPLYDPAAPTNTWRLRGAVDFDFPTNTSLTPQGRLLVVAFDPVRNPIALAAFKAQYGLVSAVPIVGPYNHSLGNGGAGVALQFPDVPMTNGVIPYVEAERVDYNDNDPWPAAADGLGYSLNRVDPAAFANDPAHWQAARPSPGTGAPAAASLSITEQPAGGSFLAGQRVTLTVGATGTPTLHFQWRHDGADIPGATNTTWVITNAQASAVGKYMAVVLGGTGALNSDPTWIDVDVDSDGDGIPDRWESNHGGDPFNPADANQDPDGDGRTSLQEYQAGTDPRDAADRLRILRLEAGTSPAVVFTGAAFRTYTLQSADTLTNPGWVSIARLTARGKAFTVELPDARTAASARYYRLLASPTP